ncbi:thiamine-phosphate kinase [Govanella unica]|uniref:Thiamine-monophosphate kinase n=1 Tax=Govanella unica TaxID=2975056 RepID=A0A9X3TY14_9PROT|nr:thiamine-phosphate kinase [Govania unica]MDA5194091.1 thiamine-phosphate kinase [Govania unica]
MAEQSSLGEFGAIAAYFAPLAGPEGLGLLDDAALYTPPPGQTLVLTKDAMVAGVHFFPDESPMLVARKLARVNLSDLAAMGAEPVGYLLAVAVPKDKAEYWMKGLAEGFAQVQMLLDWRLWGGDTVTTTGPVTLSMTAIGTVPEGQALRRSGARAGDRVFVSGTIGDAALGLLQRQGKLGQLPQEAADFLRQRLCLPNPRLGLGVALRGLAHAAQDVSDGLAADLGHLAAASGLAARITLERIPQSAAAREVMDSFPELKPQIFAGDDYELLFTVAPDRVAAVAALSRDLNLALTDIGEMCDPATVDWTGVRLFHEDGSAAEEAIGGYRHF